MAMQRKAESLLFAMVNRSEAFSVSSLLIATLSKSFFINFMPKTYGTNGIIS
jgi:hypothetical protein